MIGRYQTISCLASGEKWNTARSQQFSSASTPIPATGKWLQIKKPWKEWWEGTIQHFLCLPSSITAHSNVLYLVVPTGTTLSTATIIEAYRLRRLSLSSVGTNDHRGGITNDVNQPKQPSSSSQKKKKTKQWGNRGCYPVNYLPSHHLNGRWFFTLNKSSRGMIFHYYAADGWNPAFSFKLFLLHLLDRIDFGGEWKCR